VCSFSQDIFNFSVRLSLLWIHQKTGSTLPRSCSSRLMYLDCTLLFRCVCHWSQVCSFVIYSSSPKQVFCFIICYSSLAQVCCFIIYSLAVPPVLGREKPVLPSHFCIWLHLLVLVCVHMCMYVYLYVCWYVGVCACMAACMCALPSLWVEPKYRISWALDTRGCQRCLRYDHWWQRRC